ncbi:MAG TPA: tRNA-binding protein [Pyrinomonadaceae bacterium]|jgi:tRNA-binding protein
MSDESNFIEFPAFAQVEVRVGVISSVEVAEGCRVAAYKLTVDFGPEVGVRRSVAQATNYAPEQLVGKQVLAVVNLKPRQVGKHVSEVLVLGVPTEGRGTALVVPDMEAVVGGRLF